MARSNRVVSGYDFLDRHAEVIERLVPGIRAVAFFDARGRPLRAHGPVPLSHVRLQVRSVLKSTAIASGRRPLNAILPVTASERAASFVLYAASGTRGPHRTASPVAGVCLVVFHVTAGGECPPVESLQAQLEPALACVGDHLARYAAENRGCAAEEGVRDLEWLYEVTSPGPHRGGAAEARSDHGERLARLVGATVAHLECALCALVVPERQLRIIRTAEAADGTEEALRRLAPPVLSWVQTKDRPLVVNKTTTWNRDRGAAARGAPLAVRLLAVPVNGHGSLPAGALMLLRPEDAPEFTRRHLSLAQLLGRHVACLLETDFDVLTGLRTRSSAQIHVASWEQATPQPPGPHSVIFLGIDRLGIVNDTLGFDAGDALIVRVAQLLAPPHLPPDVVAARISSDKFAIALPRVDADAAADTARALQQAAAQLSPASAAGEAPVSLSCGIACFTQPREFPSALALAQLACRSAKDHGRGAVEIYQDDDDSMIRRKSDSIAVIRLRDALQHDRFTLVAQRIMPLQGRGDPEGFELLLRSPNEDHAPADLLAAAHRSQLAPALDMWVVEHALAGAASHRSALLAANVSLSINITGPSLTDATFLERIERLIRRSRIAPALLTFEITETIAVLNLAKAINFVRELRAMGCRFALDDFGTGTNSLKNLMDLPVDRIKIDGSFVTGILSDPQSVAMVRAIVSLAQDLGIGTVAEYAENARIIERLRELGVQYAQGYGVEKPRAFKDVLNELSARESQKNAALGGEV